MINFRFYLVSIVAVFLALAIGVVMGYGVLGQPTVNGLQRRIDTIGAHADAQRAANEMLSQELAATNSGLQAATPFAVTDRLLNRQIIVLVTRGANEDAVTRISKNFLTSGANSTIVVWLENSWKLSTDKERSSISGILGTENIGKKAEIQMAANSALIARLTAGQPLSGVDILAKFVDAGFVSLSSPEGGANKPAELGGATTRLVLAVAPNRPNTVKMIATAAVTNKIFLTVVEIFTDAANGIGRESSITAVLNNLALKNAVATVNNGETDLGALAAVLALADLENGVVSHLGTGENGERLLPGWWRL